MTRLIGAEVLKLRTTQVWFWLLLGAVAVSALFVIGPLAGNDIHNSGDVADMFSNAGIAYTLTFVLGVLGVTTEFRYQTITPTLLATPSRWAVVTAKMITYAIAGILYAAVCVVVELLIAVPWLSAKGVDYSLGSDHVPQAIVSVFVTLALFGIIGLGVGALLKNQVVAVTVGVIFLVVLQNILVAIPGVKHVYPYLPGGAAAAIATVPGTDRTVNGVELLSGTAGVIVLVLWAIVPAVIGAAFTLNRDIT
ncbi:ABC transporter permease [uncultured Jatrophihabitans sp.]|uniref:ABC transporter permease n=1 Tax=uncultured Jatrophihabitans sp. TaxID=1610747 RepID=UPI0035CACF64